MANRTFVDRALTRREAVAALAAGSVAANLVTPAAAKTTAGNALPRLVVVGTGGTIAGAGASSVNTGTYDPAKVAIEDILKAVPELQSVADVRGEQLFQIASHSYDDAHMLLLGRRVSALLKQPDVDGVVITHGTDTIEETAYLLNLTLKSNKPVVVVGAMRPGTALSADGPLNLYNAVIVASCAEAKGKGVLVVMNDQIYSARDVTKSNSLRVDTFTSQWGPLGLIAEGKPYFYRLPARPHTILTEFDIDQIDSLPKVTVFYGSVSMDPAIMDAITTNGVRGLIYAGPGDGSVADYMKAALRAVRMRGIIVVRASRTGSGVVVRNASTNDDVNDWIVAADQNPQKARMLISLGLTKTSNSKALEDILYKY
jgi:glutamin-(asparagin-)ase